MLKRCVMVVTLTVFPSLAVAFPSSGKVEPAPTPPAGTAPAAGEVKPAILPTQGSEVRPAAPASEPSPITGKVLQSMKGGGYAYVLLQKGEENIWLAMPEMQVVIGSEMTFAPGMEMHNFNSKALNRVFDRIIFTGGPMKQEGGKPGSAPKTSASAAKGKGEKISVEKAAGPDAYQIADLFRLKNKLDKKKVVVRGKVTQVTTGIMNRNWIHLEDGSGNAKKGTHELVVTSDAVPEVGAVITITGTLAKDRDFGGRYRYKVLVEKAEIAIQ